MIRPLTVLLAAILLLGPLVVAELGVRALVQSGRLPEAPSSNALADVSLANALRRDRADILAVGTSIIRSTLHPDTLEELAAAEVGRDIHVQNVGQGALSLDSQRLLVRGLAERGRLPEVVVVAVSPFTMGDVQFRLEWFEQSELGRSWSGCAGLDEPDLTLCRISGVSALWRWRGRPDLVAEAIIAGFPTTRGDGRRRLEESGWVSEPAAKLENLETRALEKQIRPVLKEFPPSPRVEEAFAALVDELRAQGSTVVVVALPYSELMEEVLEERYPGWHEDRDAAYARLAEAADQEIIVVESWDDWWELALHKDHRHLGRDGAAPATRQLWELDEFREPIVGALDSGG